MKSIWYSRVAALSLLVFFFTTGCVTKAQFDRCVRRNDIQGERIRELEAAQEAGLLGADRTRQEYLLLKQEKEFWQQKLDALQASLAAKNALIDQLTEQLGQTALPIELSNALADWAGQADGELVSYDEKTGIVRFKSDLLFDKGQDTVQAEAQRQLTYLAEILNSSAANAFDVLIVGHTDDVPILKPATLVKHPTNWHLSAHRAIAVEKILAESGLAQTRLAVMGMGQFRPIEPNKPGRKGNPRNRRVEIYIVPAGQVRTVP